MLKMSAKIKDYDNFIVVGNIQAPKINYPTQMQKLAQHRLVSPFQVRGTGPNWARVVVYFDVFKCEHRYAPQLPLSERK